MKITSIIALISLSLCCHAPAQLTIPPPNNDPYFAGLYVLQAPQPKGPVLRRGDRLAICGDSITEQKMYSRIMETYLTVALPELNVTTRQYGWSGEQASGFLHRMTNDVLRFNPTVATTCYGMNDHHYRPYEPSIGEAYASNTTDIVLAFQSDDTRVVLGAPGCMGFTTPPWGFIQGTAKERNINLCTLRDIDIDISQVEHTGFADVFWDMYVAQYIARQWYGTNYTLAGKDSVHPGWAGHLVMAYAFLKALDVPGDIGTFTVDLAKNEATVSAGHRLISFDNGAMTIQSTRYPFCATGGANDPNSIRSGMTLVPFNQELNRLILIVKNGKAANYQIAWGPSSRTYSAQQLRKGVNLAADFDFNPFSDAFARVDQAVARKQDFETQQVKKRFHGEEGKADFEKTVSESEKDRAVLMDAIRQAFVPITHTITITPQ
ncbi:MAG TPA: SGNH/GDSL hydrolase family protein [Verrucomicrobiae bacterium]|nr:SGNH/GDSL hydrolase family protein [Verrucomicrobiae bacterium]